jgi:hypothetical protein
MAADGFFLGTEICEVTRGSAASHPKAIRQVEFVVQPAHGFVANADDEIRLHG